MWKRLSGAGLILFVSICAACSRNKAPALPQPTQPSDAYVESVNTTSGTLTIDADFNEDKQPAVINFSQAYARVVTNPEDRNKKDVLVVMLEQPLPRAALSVIEDDNDPGLATMDFFEMLKNRDARGVVLRVPADRNPASGSGEENIRTLFNGGDYDFGNLVLELKTLTGDKAEGRIKSNVDSLQADVNFVVQLRPNVWTGGTFYVQPSTKLSPGQASGQIAIEDRVVNLNHAYARLIEFDLFDETKNVYKVWLSEKPVDVKALADYGAEPPGARNVVLSFTTSEPGDRSQLTVSTGDQFDSLPDVERDFAKFGKDGIEGRLYSMFLVEVRDRGYKPDVLFNATMLPPRASDGPVTASEGGDRLPADGGDPTKAYLAAMEKMKGVKNIDEGLSTWSGLVTKDAAERIKKDVQSLTGEQRQVLVDVFAPLENPKLTGGLIKDNKATLRFSGASKGQRAEEVVNMHLEDGQWKIGRREIRVN
jgi:hypothetical protein